MRSILSLPRMFADIKHTKKAWCVLKTSINAVSAAKVKHRITGTAASLQVSVAFPHQKCE